MTKRLIRNDSQKRAQTWMHENEGGGWTQNDNTTLLEYCVELQKRGAKVVINITVNAEGRVVTASFNGSSTTSDGCLVDHALEYAKASKFNSDTNKPSQIGTITFMFKSKY